MVLLHRHDIGFLFGAFAGCELQQLFIQRVVIDLAILVLEQDVEKLAEMGEWVGRASLALGCLEVVVRLGVGAVMRLTNVKMSKLQNQISSISDLNSEVEYLQFF